MFSLHSCFIGVQVTKEDKLNCKAIAEERKEGQINEFQWEREHCFSTSSFTVAASHVKKKKKINPFEQSVI